MSGRSKQILILVSWSLLLVLHAQPAEQPILTFPHIAVGSGIRLEINISNMGNQIANAQICFRQNNGDPLFLTVDGMKTRAVDFAIPPGGSRKFAASSADELQIGYALVTSSDRPRLVGSLVFTTNDLYDVSVPNSPATTRAHVVVDRGKFMDSAVAFLNTGSEKANLKLSLRDEKGTEIATGTLELEAGCKVPSFLAGLVKDVTGSGLPAELTGLLNITSDKPFHLLGLRQRLPSQTLASLTTGDGSYPEVGSQIIYLIDSGIDLTTGAYSEEELRNKTVFELTGIAKAARSENVVLRNTNGEKAVTLKCSYINDQGEEFFSFLLVLTCGQTLVIDPFDFEIPGYDQKTSEVIFGTKVDAPSASARRWTAAGFRSGRFLFAATAVGMSRIGGATADILYPSLLAQIGQCGIDPLNTGSGSLTSPFAPGDLHVCNALPMAFDYLAATMREPSEECGETVDADLHWTTLTAFTRTMRTAVGADPTSTCSTPSVPADPERVFEAFAALNRQSDRANSGWPTALVIYNGSATYRLNR